MPKLTKRSIDALSPREKEIFVWDSELRGFGMRAKPSGAKTFVVQYKTRQGATRRTAVGRYGTLTLEQGRTPASCWLMSLVDSIHPNANAVNGAP